jgi:hypothetical protein
VNSFLNYLIQISILFFFRFCDYISFKSLFTVTIIIPLKVYSDLPKHEKFKEELHRVGGVYGFIHNEEGYKKNI